MHSACSWCRSGRGHRNAISWNWNDLRLVREDFAAIWIDQYFQPIHVIGSILLMVAEGFNADAALETAVKFGARVALPKIPVSDMGQSPPSWIRKGMSAVC